MSQFQRKQFAGLSIAGEKTNHLVLCWHDSLSMKLQLLKMFFNENLCAKPMTKRKLNSKSKSGTAATIAQSGSLPTPPKSVKVTTLSSVQNQHPIISDPSQRYKAGAGHMVAPPRVDLSRYRSSLKVDIPRPVVDPNTEYDDGTNQRISLDQKRPPLQSTGDLDVSIGPLGNQKRACTSPPDVLLAVKKPKLAEATVSTTQPQTEQRGITTPSSMPSPDNVGHHEKQASPAECESDTTHRIYDKKIKDAN
ncbi:hypothetical protein B0O99DRAFT_605224 [Bisporella sp. PMI_857]|nr:hypothetical protein B0O99DRAFT_605224 [Bisporella sp. PMI_857]